MAARIYTLPIENGAILAATGDYDLWEVTPASNKPCEITGIEIAPNSELGDAQEEQLRIAFIRGHATSGSGGAAATPQKADTADAASSFTAETLNGTIASAGTGVTVWASAFNVRVGIDKQWAPGFGLKFSAADVLGCLRLMAAAVDDLNLNGTLTVAEY